MQQRKKQPVQTRLAILSAAHAEFSRNGYAGSGISAIIERSGMTKGALFHHFSDKRALAEAWITEFLAPAVSEVWIAPLDEVRSLDGLQKFCRARFLGLQPDDAVSTLVALTAELAAGDDALATALEAVFSAWRGAVSELLVRGRDAGWIYPSIQPDNEAALIVCAFTGFTVTAKSNRNPDTRRHALLALDGYLETLRAQQS